MLLASTITFLFSLPAVTRQQFDCDMLSPELHHQASSDLRQPDLDVKVQNLNRLQDFILVSPLVDSESDSSSLLCCMSAINTKC